MIDIEAIKSRFGDHPLVVPLKEHGGFRIFETYARAVCDVLPENLSDEDQAFEKIQSVTSAAFDTEQQRPVRLSIHLRHEALALPDIDCVLAALASILAPHMRPRILLHVGEPWVDWDRIHSLFKSLREKIISYGYLQIHLLGPFGELAESEMAKMFDLMVQVRYTAGWGRECPREHVPAINYAVLRSLSRFGFATPVEWYVHSGNTQAFEEQLPGILQANQYSGFSLPLISANPYFRFASECPALPDALEYCGLLTRHYSRYRHYDEVFAPLNSLSLLIGEGARNSNFNVHSQVQMIVDEVGIVKVFRHSPALGAEWISVNEILSMKDGALGRCFLEFMASAQQREWASYCGECRWRFICGGLDLPSPIALSDANMDTLCGHRKLFLGHFANLRGPDCIIGEPGKQTVSPD
jgi:hypothetical protein